MQSASASIWLTASVAAIALTGCAAGDAPSAKSQRQMVFLARNAVVREAPDRVDLVSPDRAPAVVIGRDAAGPRQSFEDGQIARAAKVMAQYVEKITGVKCAVAPAGKPQTPALRIGAAGNPQELFPELARADAHGFVIALRDGDLHIVGASGTGTLYGVWFFLQNYADVRQVLPGELGMVCPRRERLEVPRDLYVFNPGPDYLLRIWSGSQGLDPEAWLADSNVTQRFEYHHAAGRIYDPKKFGQTHPEYYPVYGGKAVVLPPDMPHDAMSGWQPTFSEPAVARRAVEYAGEVFRKSPWKRSVSVTVNDGGGFSERDYQAAEAIPGGKGRLSDVYYDYVNRVARGIRAEFPDKYVASLAYMAVEPPPAFALEDNVILFVLNEPKEVVGKWGGKARHWGVYMWLFGNNWWLIPNHWPHAMQDSLRWMRAKGFVAFKAEIYGRWSQDGPKTWVLNNLLWNADADVDALLKDYFEHAYGPEAAPAVARYFAQAEAIHARRMTPERYNLVMEPWRGDYRPREQQFADVTPDDVRLMAAALADARGAVRGDDNGKRLSCLEACFVLWRSFWEQSQIIQRLQRAQVAGDADVQGILATASRFYGIPKDREAHFRARIEPHPQFCYFAKDADVRLSLDRVEAECPWIMSENAMCLGLESISAYQRRKLSPAEVARFWADVARTRPELAAAVRMQQILGVYPDRPFRTAIGDGTVGAAVNAGIVAEITLRGNAAVTPDEIARSKEAVSRKMAEASPEARDVGPQAGRLAVCNRSSAPTIDGRLDDAAWRNAVPVEAFFAAKTFNPARYRTEVRLLHDGTNLYVGFRAWQDTKGLRAAVRFRDMKVWEDDSVELMICDPAASQPAAGFHIIINALGVLYDQFDGKAEWDSRAVTAATVDAEGYTVEFSVPLKEIGVDFARSRFMRVNFARGAFLPGKLDPRNPWDKLSTWYPHQGNNIDPRYKGWLVFNGAAGGGD